MADRTDPPGWPSVHFGDIDSTNAEALRRAADGERGPLWITADHQSRGRGRSGRSWTSAGGSLAATLLFSPACELSLLPGLSLVAGVAAHAAIQRALPAEAQSRVRLKWPNDVLIAGDKVSGILIESTSYGAGPVAVIGTGINIGESARLDGRSTASLAEHGSSRGRADVAGLLAAELGNALGTWDCGRGFGGIREAWLRRAGPSGEPLIVNAGSGPVAGHYVGLDMDGALLLDVGGGAVRRFAFADVTLAGMPAAS